MASVPLEEGGVVERLLPLRHWLGAEAGRNMDQGQARTRLMCTLVALLGFAIGSLFVDIPDLVVAISFVYTLYALALAWHVDRQPAPSHWRRGICVVFDNVIEGVGAPDGVLGCLMVNSAAELAPNDPEVTAVVKDYDDTMIGLLTRAIQRGQERGELSQAYSAEQTALMFFNTLQGTRLLIKVGYSKAQLVALRDMCLNSLT